MCSAEVTTEIIIDHGEDSGYMVNEYNIDSVQDDNRQNITSADAPFSTIYLQDGQCLVSADNEAIILESSNEGVNQYVLNDGVDMMQLDVNDPQVLENMGMVRYYDQETGQIYYCKTINGDDSNYIAIASENDGTVLADNEIVINSDHSLSKNETLKFEFIHPAVKDDVVDLPSENEFITSINERTKYSYAILKDGKLHLQTMEHLSSDNQLQIEHDDRFTAQLEALHQSMSSDNPEMGCDLGSVTGKNLITGQVVTLDSYLERLEKRKTMIQEEILRSPVKRQSRNCSSSNRIINRKAVSEKLGNGRKLKGRIVKIEKKNVADNSKQVIEEQNKVENENINRLSTTPDTLSKAKAQTLLGLKDAKEKVSSTLVGLMELDSIQDQLKDKSIVIKLIEKTYDFGKNCYDKAVAYFYGRMITKENNKGKLWEFVLINNVTEVKWMNKNISNGFESPNKLESMACVYLLVTTDKNGKKTTRVNIEHVPYLHCPFCNKTVETSMKVHLSQVHVTETTIGFVCSQCELNFDSMTRLQKHLRIHSRSYGFECGTCSKKFTRHTNWQRHMDVHKSASEVAYHCDICGCGFNYASSLTRHIVQKHINNKR